MHAQLLLTTTSEATSSILPPPQPQMPFCNVDKDVALYYITNTESGGATDLDRTKHTIILLPHIFCAVTMWFREQFKDSRLSQQYNLIAFDLRNMGSTISPLQPQRDAWVDAADLAVAHEILRLPPCHLFAVSMLGCGAALRFAALFPSKCLSLGLCGPPLQAGEDPEWVEQGYRDIILGCCFPNDLDALERACMEHAWFAFNNQITADLLDEVIAWWQMNLPPTKRTSFLAQALCALQRSRFSDEELSAMKIPTLFLQGDKCLLHTSNDVQELCDKLPNGRVFIVKGGPEFMNIIPEYASVINRVYSQFLAPLSHTSPAFPNDQVRPNPAQVCEAGLRRLAGFAGDSTIAQRDPSTPLSFSCLSAETIVDNAVKFSEFAIGESEAFNPLDESGKPIRKFSERYIDEWKVATSQRIGGKSGLREGGMVTMFETSSISGT